MTYSCVKGSESLSHDGNQGGTASKSRPFVDGAFLFYRKLRRISYKVKKRSAWIALRRNRICRFATRRRRRILRSRILFLSEYNICIQQKRDTPIHVALSLFSLMFLSAPASAHPSALSQLRFPDRRHPAVFPDLVLIS